MPTPAFSAPSNFDAADPTRRARRAPHAHASMRARARGAPVHDPRVLAALCYVVPVVPGALLLWRERDRPFVRFHAAQSLVFFGLIAAGQIGIYLVLIVAGGLITSDLVAIGTAVVIVGLFAALGITAFYVWLGLLADCIRGRARRLPIAGAWAVRLERLEWRMRARTRSASLRP